nr:restriction endonuclease [Sporohalobacter salinus]
MKRLSKLLLKNEKFLLSLSSKEFEDEITDLFKEKGFELEQTSYVNDGGKDAVGFKNNKKYLFEYKQYGKGSIVGRPDIQKFHSAIVEEEADKGYFITISRFSKPAVNLANKFGIRLIEGTELLRMFEEVYPTDLAEEAFKVMCLECGEIVKFENIESNRSSKCKNGHIVECNISKPNFKIRTSPENKICKLCGSKMQKRKGSYGKFWGCSNYPRCNYTESIR